MTLCIIAIVKAKPDHKETIKKELEKLVLLTRNEVGCIKYDLFVDNQDSTRFIIEETWSSYDNWQLHIKSNHIINYTDKTSKLIEDKQVIQLTQLK